MPKQYKEGLPPQKAYFPLTYEGVFGKYEYNNEYSLEANEEVVLRNYDNATPLNTKQLETVIGTLRSQYSLESTARTPAEQKAAKELSNQARKKVVHAAARLKQLSLDNPGSNLKRHLVFLRPEGDQKADDFNQKLIKAHQAKNKRAIGELLYEEMQSALQTANIKSPEDVSRLYELSDQELVERFDKIDRFIRLFGEGENIIREGYFTKEMEDQIKPLISMAHSLLQVFNAKLDVIANPYYPYIDPTSFWNDRLSDSITEMDDAIGELVDEEKDGRQTQQQPLFSFFNSIATGNAHRGAGVLERAQFKNPALRTATFSTLDNEDMERKLSIFQPVVARTQGGNTLVLTNKEPLQVQSAQEHMRGLSELADKADKWLLTGSKQFANMQKALKALSDADAAEMAEKVYALEDAARTYLRYKGIEEPYQQPQLLNRGKNRREQSRMDIAGEILAYAMAHGSALKNELEMKEATAAKEAAKKREEPKPEPVKQEPLKLTDNDPERINRFHNNIVEKMSFKMNGAAHKDFTPTPKQFALLSMLACGSPKAYYVKQNKNLVEGRERVENRNPAATYSKIMQTAMFEGNVAKEKGWDQFANMMSGAQSVVRHAIEKGNFELLGELVADGLRQNNALLQKEKGITDRFTAYAEFGADVFSMLQGASGELADAAEKHLKPEDLGALRAAKAISDLREKGLASQKALVERLSKGETSEMDAEDISNICQMYGVNTQLASGSLDLANCPYSGDKDMAAEFNRALVGNEPLTSFLAKSAQEKLAAIQDPKEMTQLYLNGIRSTLSVNQAKDEGVERQSSLSEKGKEKTMSDRTTGNLHA